MMKASNRTRSARDGIALAATNAGDGGTNVTTPGSMTGLTNGRTVRPRRFQGRLRWPGLTTGRITGPRRFQERTRCTCLPQIKTDGRHSAGNAAHWCTANGLIQRRKRWTCLPPTTAAQCRTDSGLSPGLPMQPTEMASETSLILCHLQQCRPPARG